MALIGAVAGAAAGWLVLSPALDFTAPTPKVLATLTSTVIGARAGAALEEKQTQAALLGVGLGYGGYWLLVYIGKELGYAQTGQAVFALLAPVAAGVVAAVVVTSGGARV